MKLNSIFTSHMVFAAHKPIRIFGEGKGCVTVEFDGKKIGGSFDTGSWLIEFDPMEYGGPYTVKVSFEDSDIILEDVYVGEVYLFSGQSNMDFSMRYLKNFNASDYCSNDNLRLFVAKEKVWKSRFSKYDGWQICDSDQIISWSALAYLAGNEISKTQNIAVGVIVCAFGASIIESWVPEGSFQQIGIDLSDNQKFCDHTLEEYSRWNVDGYLYETELSPLMPFSLSYVVWYQGESDASVDEGKVYLNELCELIRIWRNGFNDERLPFAIVQIADFTGRDRYAWSLIQKAQAEAENVLDNVTTVISRDVCEDDEIHPPTKDKLAKRIAGVLINNI